MMCGIPLPVAALQGRRYKPNLDHRPLLLAVVALLHFPWSSIVSWGIIKECSNS